MKRNGFSLTELAIVIVMIGILFGLTSSFYQHMTTIVQDTEQQKRVDGISLAVSNYQKTAGLLPCPADGTLAPNNANYGIALSSCTPSCSGGDYDHDHDHDSGGDCGDDYGGSGGGGSGGGGGGGGGGSGGGSTSGSGVALCGSNVAHGIVPFKTLNIPLELATDFKNNMISYHVDSRFTVTKCNIDGSIVVNDMNNNKITDKAIFVVVGHGANQTGSYSVNGGSPQACTSSTSDYENCNNDSIFKIQKSILTSGSTYFDDFVSYGTNPFKQSCIDNFYGCTLWLDASDFCSVIVDTSSTNAIATLQDKGPSYLVASQASSSLMPYYMAATADKINGNNTIAFNGSLLSITSPTIIPTTNFTITAVFNTSSLSGTILGVTTSSSSSATGDRFIGLSSGKVAFYMSSLGTITSSNTYNDGRTHIVTVISSSSSGTSVYVDGSLVISDTDGTSSLTGQTNVTIGGNTSSNGFGFFTGKILEVTSYNIVMTADQRRDLETKLADKWAVKY